MANIFPPTISKLASFSLTTTPGSIVKTFLTEMFLLMTYTFPYVHVVGSWIFSSTSTTLQFCGISSSGEGSLFSQDSIPQDNSRTNANCNLLATRCFVKLDVPFDRLVFVFIRFIFLVVCFHVRRERPHPLLFS